MINIMSKDTTRVLVHAVFMDDDYKPTRLGSIIELSNDRVPQAVKDGWVTIEGERVNTKKVSKGSIKKGKEPDTELDG